MTACNVWVHLSEENVDDLEWYVMVNNIKDLNGNLISRNMAIECMVKDWLDEQKVSLKRRLYNANRPL